MTNSYSIQYLGNLIFNQYIIQYYFTMTEYMLNAFIDQIKSSLSSITGMPFAIMNQIFQILAFTTAASSFMSYILKMVNFSYSETISESWPCKIIFFYMFFTIKIWDQWTQQFIIISYLCSFIIALYMYQTCANIGEAYLQINRQIKIIIAIAIFIITIFTYLLYFHYQQFDFYLKFSITICLLMLITTSIYLQSFVKPLLCVIILNLIIISRYLVIHKFNNLIFKQLPVECLFYVVMAFDSQAKEHKYNKAQNINDVQNTRFWLLKSCISFYIYGLLNQRYSGMEYSFGVVALMMLILKK